MEVSRCGIHGFHETLGIDVDELRFYWALVAQDEHAVQTAYRVALSTSKKALGASDPPAPELAWDSGRVESSAQRDVLCSPERGFRSTCNYFWKVTVWDQDGKASHGPISSFFTAYPRSRLLPPLSMNQTYMPHTALIFRPWFEHIEDKWKPWWIGDGGDKPLYLRRSFTLDTKPSQAIVFASGLGHFNFSVNGAPASDHRLDPGWTNYHRRVQFVAYDVTDQIAPGENVVGAHLGNGFFAGDKGDRFFWPMYEDNTYVRYGNELCFFAEVHLLYEDGRHDVIISDDSWRVRKSATTLANIYASETHDRRLYPAGWDAPGFIDSQWPSAKGLTGPRGFLSYQSQPPVTLHETFEPVAAHSPRPGIVCYDLGQNASTMVRIVVEGAAGSEITVRYGETAHEDGTVKMPDPLFKEFETHVYSKIYLAGTGAPETWEPDFSFTSARYIQVEGVAVEEGQGLPVIHSAVGRHVSSAARRLGDMKTDKEDVNALINACKWSFASNLFSYHTDCPQIEKFGWLEVTHLLVPSTQYIRDLEALHTKILDDILDAQEAHGLVPTMAPEIRYMCGPLHDTITWGCALIFIPDLLRKYYGTTYPIPKMYQAGRRYMEYMRTKERHGGLIEHGLGDWGRGIAHGNNQANIETAIYYECLQCMSRFAAILSLPADARHWDSEAARIRAAYNQHLLVMRDRSSYPYAHYTSRDEPGKHDRDAIAQAFALQFNLVPPEHVADVQRAFLDDVADGRIRSGEIGLKYLFNTLDDLRRPDLVLQMTRQEEHPSYMRFLRRGETTLLEFWQDECRSKCHDMLGTIFEWFYGAVLGVKPTGEAYRTFDVRPPYESEFGKVEGTVESPYGLIAVEFERKGGSEAVLNVTVPTGTVATVKLPGEIAEVGVVRQGRGDRRESGSEVQLRQGSYTLTISW
ncbi:putative alpha-l-rhamnosidase protein [Neofusicoccum parvum]|uniref:Alpha-l-rhamnosidase protein n=1 Tax=Neofusicoccum parvum TaxID=310453 RepID=A0ACB5S9D5_9PEZI|nr:putative alpha-l-rhamnosidase protein [Neofusicoccum parvum]